MRERTTDLANRAKYGAVTSANSGPSVDMTRVLLRGQRLLLTMGCITGRQPLVSEKGIRFSEDLTRVRLISLHRLIETRQEPALSGV